MSDLLLRAMRCERVERPPVWLMRQAGRYMPQYRALRAERTLWEMFHDPDLAERVTQLPLELLDVDAAILFSDILVIAEALGLEIQFPDKGGPRIHPPIHSREQVLDLEPVPVSSSLSYVFETIRRLKQKISVPLIGFCGGPFTIASYMIDSTSHHAFERTMRWIKDDPESFHLLLSKITSQTIAYLREQVAAGADVLQVFDSWANMLDDGAFSEFCLPYLSQIVEALRSTQVPVILFCRSSSLRAPLLAQLNPACISCDWHLPMPILRSQVPSHIAIQGNFPPEFLKLSPEEITAGVHALLNQMQGERGFIVNLGHGITPDIPLENVQRFVKAVKEK